MKAPAKSSGSSSPAVSTPAPSAVADPGPRPGEREGLELFALLAQHEHEQVSAYYDPSTGYRGIIAIHSTVLGPALGGTRFWSYPSDTAALVDCLRLARGMTYKAAVAGLNLGGGKSVIIGDNRTTRSAVPGPRPPRRIAQGALHHGRRRRDLDRRHGVHQGRDEPRDGPDRHVGGPVPRDRLRGVPRDEGLRPLPLRLR